MDNLSGHQWHKLAAMVALAASMLGIAWAATWGWADLQAIPARNALVQWERQGGFTKQQDWQQAVDKMRLAYRFNNTSADYAADLGRLYEWQALRQPQWTQHAHEYRALAIDHFRQAVTRRPSWGFAWVHLAVSKVLNQELDDEAFSALEKAMVFGPWESGTQKKSIWLGIMIWDQLDQDLQNKVMATLERAVKIQARVMIDLLVPLGWGDKLRPMLTNKVDIMLLEKKLGISTQ